MRFGDEPGGEPGHYPGDDEEGFAWRRGDRVTSKVNGRTGRVDNDSGGPFISIVWDGTRQAIVVRANAITIEADPPSTLGG